MVKHLASSRRLRGTDAPASDSFFGCARSTPRVPTPRCEPTFCFHFDILTAVLGRFPREPLPLAPRLRNSLSASTAGGLVAYRVDQVRYFFYSMPPAALFGVFRYIVLPAVAAITMIAASPVSADVCTGNVFTEAAALYQLDPDLLRAITWVESHGQPGAVGPRLADGHRAWGAAQINDVHLPELVSYGVTQRDLLNPCINLRLSAWVLAKCIRAKGATWAAVGCYNTGPGSRNTAAQARYVRLVQHAYAGYRAQSAEALHDGRRQK
ncbi:lytic transglycosylase domain-containing protein [Burkholderia gladioli]|uniref:lytic transglycosylase domain-containing protein n=1 Tax=Burkholderia gladioli TaxID=28095 RepID=UPI001FC8E197|nr:lytic transglycosylase domain-containing protein [Burkholderia gladioli]